VRDDAFGDTPTVKLGLVRCAEDRIYEEMVFGNRSRIRTYGMALFFDCAITCIVAEEKKRMNADRTKSKKKRLDERVYETGTDSGTVSG